MVVATGTAEREPEERLAEGVDAVVGPVGVVLADVHRRVHLLAQIPEAGAHDRTIAAGRVEPRIGHQVAGDLLADEAVVGEVVVEGVDNPVSIPPGVRDLVVELVAAGLGEPDDIEPVAGEPLAEVGRGEQGIDVCLEAARVGVGDDAVDVGRIGR